MSMTVRNCSSSKRAFGKALFVNIESIASVLRKSKTVVEILVDVDCVNGKGNLNRSRQKKGQRVEGAHNEKRGAV
ncbi:uncharacterized protein Bfra_002801 [Botrytis fragariae]|uniref:Uncharacterized protein n=1 Tax=Botrytis fragariae TaxID=1964551 RepID=A0A8H6AZM2_9HELO|nr:uncharacterized protein Bfra_002801 [Botrytis fragariae]KAF5876397.1 hypothetical protein Bfra_002801 [Botrytis fragariae]